MNKRCSILKFQTIENIHKRQHMIEKQKYATIRRRSFHQSLIGQDKNLNISYEYKWLMC